MAILYQKKCSNCVITMGFYEYINKYAVCVLWNDCKNSMCAGLRNSDKEAYQFFNQLCEKYSG